MIDDVGMLDGVKMGISVVALPRTARGLRAARSRRGADGVAEQPHSRSPGVDLAASHRSSLRRFEN